MNDRPRYTKWKRTAGGMKVCPSCGHRHKPVLRIEGKAVRPKVCVECGATLPPRLQYPKKAAVQWFVRELDPATGKTRDLAADSSEDADEMIRRLTRDWTADPIQARLIEKVSVIVRGIHASDDDEAVNTLIEKLGGDPLRRKLKPIGWNEAREIIAGELRDKGLSETYVADVLRVTSDLGIITGASDWSLVDLDTIAAYRKARLAGGWSRDGRTIKAVAGRAVNKDLATLAAFMTRAVKKNWMVRNPLEGAADERVKVRSVRVEYMPDDDLRRIIQAADSVWFRTFIVVSYYTAARRSDVLRLEWQADVDLDGTKAAVDGRSGAHIFVRGTKADTPHWMPLHPAAVKALEDLRREPIISPKVFPIRDPNPGPAVSHMFADLCVKAGVVEVVDQDGRKVTKNRWSLHDLRRKANTDLRNRGASPKERASLLGHRTMAVNESNYEAVIPSRERELVDGLPVFGIAQSVA